jgi:hypothetical protein
MDKMKGAMETADLMTQAAQLPVRVVEANVGSTPVDAAAIVVGKGLPGAGRAVAARLLARRAAQLRGVGSPTPPRAGEPGAGNFVSTHVPTELEPTAGLPKRGFNVRLVPAVPKPFGKAAEPLIRDQYYPGARLLPENHPAYDAVIGGTSSHVLSNRRVSKLGKVPVTAETIIGGTWISMKTVEEPTSTPNGVTRVVNDAMNDIANKRGSRTSSVPDQAGRHWRLEEATPDEVIIHLQLVVPVTDELRAAAEAAAKKDWGEGMPKTIRVRLESW